MARKRSTYFPIRSVSRFTSSPICLVGRVVSARVWGMMDTEKLSLASRATVRLMPSMAIDPFMMIWRSVPSSASMVYHTALSSRWMRRIVPTASMCPDTTWPPNRPSAAMARSRFTGLPACREPRLLWRKVSCMTSALNWFGPSEVTVRQTPFTAMESPSRVFSSTVCAPMDRVAEWAPRRRARTVPTSSTMPVNMGPPRFPTGDRPRGR